MTDLWGKDKKVISGMDRVFYKKWSNYYYKREIVHDELNRYHRKWKRFPYVTFIRLLLYNIAETAVILWLAGVIVI